jgi:hypothetical protein
VFEVDSNPLSYSEDTDGDSYGNDCDSDDDNDFCLDDVDDDPLNADDDYDEDGTPDDCDDDDDNDGALDENDSDDENQIICSDTDGDTCDDCSSGTYDPSQDGFDYDGDSLCDAGDPDDDNDGALDDDDSDDNDVNVCSDRDEDGCDECASGIVMPTNNDGPDFDCDGTCDAGDTTIGGEITLSWYSIDNSDADDDNDGLADLSDENTRGINYDLASCEGISGFQFHVDGVDLISATDGALTVYTGNNNVVAFDMGGAQLDPGSGSLASLEFFAEFNGATLGLSNVVIGSSDGIEITTYGPDTTDISACTNNRIQTQELHH